MKSKGQLFETDIGGIRLYQCPLCHAEWFEFVDADEYPEHCPHCGRDLPDSTALRNQITEEPM